MPCHAIPYHAMPYQPCHTMPYHAMPCQPMPCHAMPCHAMPCHTSHHAGLMVSSIQSLSPCKGCSALHGILSFCPPYGMSIEARTCKQVDLHECADSPLHLPGRGASKQAGAHASGLSLQGVRCLSGNMSCRYAPAWAWLAASCARMIHIGFDTLWKPDQRLL